MNNKNLLSIIILVIFTTLTASAQSIAGKWQCSKEFIESLKLDYWNMQGYCKFKKDGTFKAKLHRKRFTKSSYGGIKQNKSVLVNIYGTYRIENNQLSTTVTYNDVSCYVESLHDKNPYIDKQDEETNNMRMQAHREVEYDNEMNMSERIADNIKNSVVQQWNWRNKPLEVTKNGLTIDNIPYFYK